MTRSCSADPALGRHGRRVLGALLVALALGVPAAGLAAARFGGTAQVTITISIAPSTPGAP